MRRDWSDRPGNLGKRLAGLHQAVKRKIISVEGLIGHCREAEEHIMWSNCSECPWRDKCEKEVVKE